MIYIIKETWINSANSYRLSEHFSYGFTFIIAIRTQTYANYIGSKLIPFSTTEELSRFDSRIRYNYWNVKGLVRLSMALDYERFRFGWTITPPSLNLFGRASVKREFALVNNPNMRNNFPADAILTSNADKIKTIHKYPLSTALGTSVKLKNNDSLHFSTELFLGINKYKVFSSDIEPVAFPTAVFDSIADIYFTDINFLELSEQAKFVINFSIGYENFLTEKWGLLTGFCTDFNFNSSDDFDLGELRPYYSSWDIYLLIRWYLGYYKRPKNNHRFGSWANTKNPDPSTA
ncbi:MAG: hypothetical protein DRJ07_08865 [Bacteroidetes bacterium]|nr:MAG: hypothetical protein DRJ07_08865 [Bacteroidota bacterium]